LLFVGLYYQFGITGVLTALATSGLWLVGFFGTVWEKVKEPLTKRLEYLNQHAFTPLAEWCRFESDWKLNPSISPASGALSALQIHRRYLTVGLYPKTVLRLTEWVVQNTTEYEQLFNHIYYAIDWWIQREHFNEWAHLATSPNIGALLSLLGFEQPEYQVRPEITALLRPFLKAYQEKNGEKLTRFVELQKDFMKTRSAMSGLLKEYMGTNMLRKTT
jgi:hypothetical protein